MQRIQNLRRPNALTSTSLTTVRLGPGQAGLGDLSSTCLLLLGEDRKPIEPDKAVQLIIMSGLI